MTGALHPARSGEEPHLAPRPNPSVLSARWWGWFAMTYLAYVVAGQAGLMLSIPSVHASPMYPAAGVALVAVLMLGGPALAGVALGACTIVLLSTRNAALGAGMQWLVPLGIAFGTTLQALVGATLLQRFVGRPLALNEPRDMLRFYLLGAGCSTPVSASIAIGVLSVSGLLAPEVRLQAWWTWFAGDSLGVMIGAPITLTLIGQPRPDWATRRLTVGLPLLAVTLLMGLGIREMVRIDEERRRNAFEREATAASSALITRLHEPLRALEAVRSVFLASPDVTRPGFRRATDFWLLPGSGLQAIGWTQRVARGEVPAFESAVRTEGLPEFHVVDRTDAGVAPDALGDEAFVIRFIEPQQRNAAALGLNVLSVEAQRPAMQATTRTGMPAATAAFELAQGGIGVVVDQSVFSGTPTTAQERQQMLRGVVFVTLRLHDLIDTVRDTLPQSLDVCLIDNDPASRHRLLAGPPGCESLEGDVPQHVRPVAFAGRQWDVRVVASRPAPRSDAGFHAWSFSIVGLLAASMMGALLLTVTGRARRIERAVDERTADLQREVVERKRTAGALRDSEQRFRNILDHVPIGVVYTDLTGAIREANPKLRELVGYSAEELAGRSALSLTHPDDRPFDTELHERLVRGEIPMVRRQKRYVAKDGRIVWVSATVTVLRDAGGQPQRLVGVVEDITEHLKLQEAEHARESAEAANRAKSEFLSRMSHELRTPLNAMLGFSQLLELDRQQPLAPHQTEWTAQIQHAGWHLLHMINDTLDLSRIESGTLRLQTEVLDVADLVRATRSLLEHNAQRRQVIITEALDPDARAVNGDPTRVKQILTNLLSNAIKYNQRGGRITITTRLFDPQTVQFEISDTGLGMTDQQLADLFQPFNRLGREASGEEGTGIGLVISQRLADLMGGTLRARSVAGVGSTFVLQLPRAPGNGDLPPLGAQDLPAEAVSYHRRLVHYVEDNETNAEVMRGILAQREQIQLEVSCTGLDGLAAIRQRRPSLVLLDMHLPDIDGLELLGHLKRDERTADIPVVVVSADATHARIREALGAGAARYLTKPVNVAEMLAVLDEQLEQLETRFG